MNNILIIDWGLIGDTISTTPIIEILNSVFVESNIDIITNPYSSPVFFNNPNIRNIFVLNKKEYKEEESNHHSNLNLYKTIIKNKYDFCIDLIGNYRSIILSLLSNAKVKIGLKKNKIILSYLYDLPVALNKSPVLSSKIKHFLNTLNINKFDLNPVIYVSEKDFNYTKKYFNESDKKLKIGIFPGAGWEAKKWPVDNFNTVIDFFKNKPINFYIILGPRESNEFKSKCREIFKNHFIIDNLNLNLTSAFIKHLDLLISNDTGPLHISKAVKIPCIGLFGPTHPDVVELPDYSYSLNGYYNCQKRKKDSSNINPCLETYCNNPVCINNISVDSLKDILEYYYYKLIPLTQKPISL